MSLQAKLDAFKADDGPQAFAYASPAIQSIFKDADTFMTMVRAGSQPVYRPRPGGTGASIGGPRGRSSVAGHAI